MYTATMHYSFVEENFNQACEIWKDQVLDLATRQPGFVRMQLLVASPQALAIGTWESKSHAEAFMHTGVFKKLMVDLEPLCTAPPQPKIWDLACFSEK